MKLLKVLAIIFTVFCIMFKLSDPGSAEEQRRTHKVHNETSPTWYLDQ